MARFRTLYGAGPLHLVAVLASLAVAVYALLRALDLVARDDRLWLWLGGAIVAHDFILFPLYALLGVLAIGVIAPSRSRSRLRIAVLNHLRFPALMSALLLLVWFPLVGQKAPLTFMRNTGLSNDAYLGRWLAISGVLFVASALLLALRAPGLRRDSRAPGAGTIR